MDDGFTEQGCGSRTVSIIFLDSDPRPTLKAENNILKELFITWAFLIHFYWWKNYIKKNGDVGLYFPQPLLFLNCKDKYLYYFLFRFKYVAQWFKIVAIKVHNPTQRALEKP